MTTKKESNSRAFLSIFNFSLFKSAINLAAKHVENLAMVRLFYGPYCQLNRCISNAGLHNLWNLSLDKANREKRFIMPAARYIGEKVRESRPGGVSTQKKNTMWILWAASATVRKNLKTRKSPAGWKQWPPFTLSLLFRRMRGTQAPGTWIGGTARPLLTCRN